MQIEQDRQEIVEPAPVHTMVTHPPHTGFGTEEDSMASCLRLTARPPRRDINKLMNDSDKVMRFEGRVVNSVDEDKKRRFIIAVYPADDTLAIWETRQRNSGHAEGKFSKRSKKHNPATGTWFNCRDFQLGTVVEINSMPFLLTNADEGTLRYMEENRNDFPMADAELVADKITDLAPDLQQVGSRPIGLDELEHLAKERLGVQLGKHELVTLSRACGKPDVSVDTPRLVDYLQPM